MQETDDPWREIAQLWSKSEATSDARALETDVSRLLQLVGGVRAQLRFRHLPDGALVEVVPVERVQNEDDVAAETSPTIETTIELSERVSVDMSVQRASSAPTFCHSDAQVLDIAAVGLAPELSRYVCRHGLLPEQTPLDALEREIVAGLVEHEKARCTASRLGLDEQSLEARTRAIFDKLGVETRLEFMQLGMGQHRGARNVGGSRDERLEESAVSELVPSSPFLERARDTVRMLMGAESVTTKRVAKRLGASVRTLQRKLNDADTSFREMVDDIRYRRALELLADSGLAYTDIAHELGYGHVSSLNRAVQRWTGTSPGELRRDLMDR